ncbi:dirigent protein 18-like [Diospyros lotus]|uniref:dirigent protein 18-like n=1 Tax=Diospyros lotus TaxID=55363 RepID=UPI0022509335|nr:dirigent protein 18-like [Diospyros lotus]
MDVLVNLLPSVLIMTMVCFLFFFIFIDQSFSARNLLLVDGEDDRHNNIHHSLSFCIQDVLSQSHSSSEPVTTKVNNHHHHQQQQQQLVLPFPKPLGFFPPAGGIPVTSNPNPMVADSGLSTDQMLDLPAGIIDTSFPARAAALVDHLELEFGAVTVIDEALFKGAFGSVLVGKAQGMYVASSEDGISHILLAMTASFPSTTGESVDIVDGLRLFGVHRAYAAESHVAVIGGTGKYQSANGYAAIKTLNLSSKAMENDSKEAYKVLCFEVFLG